MPEPLSKLPAIWSERARTYGRRCVLDLAIPEAGFDHMTTMQWSIFEPLLRKVMPRRIIDPVLDFGCGPGRFTAKIAKATQCCTLGFDPCAELIAMVPEDTPQYVNFSTGSCDDLFFGPGFADYRPFGMIWITLVLGGLMDGAAMVTASNLVTTLRPGGLLFFAEHTSETLPGSDFWAFRPEKFYLNLFNPIPVTKIGSYETRGNEVSIFAGIKP